MNFETYDDGFADSAVGAVQVSYSDDYYMGVADAEAGYL